MWRWPSLRSPSPPPPWRGSSAAARLPGTGGWRATMRLGRLKSPVAFCRLLVVAVDEGEHAPLHSLSGLTSPAQVMDQPGVAHGPDRKSVVSGKSVSVLVVLGGRRLLKKKKT